MAFGHLASNGNGCRPLWIAPVNGVDLHLEVNAMSTLRAESQCHRRVIDSTLDNGRIGSVSIGMLIESKNRSDWHKADVSLFIEKKIDLIKIYILFTVSQCLSYWFGKHNVLIDNGQNPRRDIEITNIRNCMIEVELTPLGVVALAEAGGHRNGQENNC